MAESLFIYDDYSCGSYGHDVNELIEQFQLFKKNEHNQNESIEIIGHFLKKIREYRVEAIKVMLETDRKLLTLNNSQIILNIQYQKKKIRCENLKHLSELLTMHLLAYKQGMFDFAEEIDPDVNFDRQFKNFLDRSSEVMNINEFSEIEKKWSNSSAKKLLKNDIDGLITALDDLREDFLKNIILPEFDAQSRYDLYFSIQDQINIRSTLKLFGTIKMFMKELLDDLNQPDFEILY
ncbi:hypothetical protein HUG17_1563 [Dermatophagoides farinae]|nr:hypothetical protein HUG17_1563 [Dermatophagoides farinae]